MSRAWWRKAKEGFFWGLCCIALILIIAPAVSIFAGLLQQAWPVLGLRLLTNTSVTNGLQNAIFGSLILLLGVLIVAAPIGIGGGIYLAEYARPRPGSLLRLGYETLAGIPSIVVGFVAYVVLDVGLHWGFSLLAAILALSAIVLPYIIKNTEMAVGQVPTTLREAAQALGLSRLSTLRRAVLPPAVPGIVAGLVVALAISVGETAPLLYTVGFSSQNPTFALFQHPLAYLTYVVFINTTLPSKLDHQLAAAAGVLLILMVLLLIGLSRWVSQRAHKQMGQLPS